jgi:hypothetical protein
MVGYLATMRFTQIRVLTGEPDYSELECNEYDWAKPYMVISESRYWKAYQIL